MEKKLYQVKDITELFGITRDTIKYYEKQGLITPERSDNGYRVFDTFNVEKLKKILDLRDLGFSVKEVTEMLTYGQVEKSEALLLELRKRTEEDIRELYCKLEKIQIYERNFHDNKRCIDRLNVEFNAEFCLDCPEVEVEKRCSYFIREVTVCSMNEEGEITDKRESNIVLNNCDLKEHCQKCAKTGEKLAHVYRGIVPYEGEQRTEEIIRENYKKAMRSGHKLKKVTYITKKILTRNGKEGLFLDIRIPVEE